MNLNKLTLKAVLLDAIVGYSKKTKMHKNFIELKVKICKQVNADPEMPTLDYIKTLGILCSAYNMNDEFNRLVTKFDVPADLLLTQNVHKSIASKTPMRVFTPVTLYAWNHAKLHKHNKSGISEPEQWNWFLNEDTYFPFEKL